MKAETKQKIFIWLYRIFCYLVPCGYALWDMLIKNLINDEITITQKLGISGIFALIVIVVVAIFFFGKFLNKRKEKYTDLCIECTDDTKKKEYVAKKRKVESVQELFKNICFIAPFIIAWLVMSAVEKDIISIRGMLMAVSISMATGFGFNGIAQWIKNKGDKNEDKE